MSVTSRWTAKLKARRQLLARAQSQVAYWARRAGSAHGRALLEEARTKRALRRRQVTAAERVLERHAGISTVSDRGVALVAGFEGFRAKAYRDAVGVLTQGYGETQGVTPGKSWTRAYAAARLRERLNRDYLAPVLRECRAAGFDPSQAQADALASFAYNLGLGPFAAGHTMGDAIRSRSPARIAAAFLPYDKAGGRALPGLTRRRRAERALFLRG